MSDWLIGLVAVVVLLTIWLPIMTIVCAYCWAYSYFRGRFNAAVYITQEGKRNGEEVEER